MNDLKSIGRKLVRLSYGTQMVNGKAFLTVESTFQKVKYMASLLAKLVQALCPDWIQHLLRRQVLLRHYL